MTKVLREIYIKIYLFAMAVFSIIALFSVGVNALKPNEEDEVRDALSKILASSEFRERGKSKSIFEMLQEKFIDFIKDIWEKLNITKKIQSVFSNAKLSKEALLVLQIIAIVLIVAIIVLIVYFIVKRFNRVRKVRQEEDALLLNILKDPDEIYKKAYEYYNNGDCTLGLRFLYIAILIHFNDLNIIRINKAKTNKQYLNEIRDNKPEIYDIMVEFTHIFNRHWYGGKKVDKTTFIKWNDVYGELLKSSVSS